MRLNCEMTALYNVVMNQFHEDRECSDAEKAVAALKMGDNIFLIIETDNTGESLSPYEFIIAVGGRDVGYKTTEPIPELTQPIFEEMWRWAVDVLNSR